MTAIEMNANLKADNQAIELDTSVSEAKWLLGMVVFLGLIVVSTGMAAAALAS